MRTLPIRDRVLGLFVHARDLDKHRCTQGYISHRFDCNKCRHCGIIRYGHYKTVDEAEHVAVS